MSRVEAAIRIPWARPVFDGNEAAYLMDALSSTWVSGGPYVERLEAEFLRLHGVSHGVAVCNGTAALELALRSAGIRAGDEVVVPGFCFAAPANMVLAVCARPVFADVDPETWCLDPEAARRAVTPRCRAVIAVHTYGNLCDMDGLRQITAERGLVLIEDAAEAAFSRYGGRLAGTLGDIGCFSFQATKMIATGEGGFVLCRDAARGPKLRLLRDHGMRPGKRYWHDAPGHNFRMTNLQAAVGCAQLERLDERTEARAKLYRAYRERLEGQRGLQLQRFGRSVDPIMWAFAVKLDAKAFPPRDVVMESLSNRGIECRPGFYPFSAMPIYGAGALPISEAIGLNVLSLPSYPGILETEIDLICGALLEQRL